MAFNQYTISGPLVIFFMTVNHKNNEITYDLYFQEGVEYDGSASSGVDDSAFPNRLVEGTTDSGNHTLPLDGTSHGGESKY